MPSAGRFDYPVRPLDDLITYLRHIYDVAGPVATREVVAQALDMAAKGGGFATLVSAMQNYGLVETGAGQVKVTDLGKRVAYETDPALLSQAKAEAVSQVGLFKDYFAQYGNDVSPDKVGVFLRKAGADVAQLPKLTEGIGKLLRDNLHYMVAVHVEGGNEEQLLGERQHWGPLRRPDRREGGEHDKMVPMNDNLIEFRMGTYLMRFPMNDKKTAKAVINTLLDAEPQESKEVEGRGAQ